MKREIVPLVSFPKSGNTWMRFILANMFKNDPSINVGFNNIGEYVPTEVDDDLESVGNNLIDSAPVFIKEHAAFDDMSNYKFEKAIYIYREGFDSLYSYWHFVDAQQPGLYKDINEFVRCYWGYCGYWGEHIRSWCFNEELKNKHSVLAISYEDLVSDAFSVIKKVVEFLNVNVDDELIRRSIERSDKKNMRMLSGSADFMKSKNKDFHFVRSASKGNSKDKLNSYCRQKFLENEATYDMMVRMRYMEEENQWRNFNRVKNIPLSDRLLHKGCHLKYRLKEIVK